MLPAMLISLAWGMTASAAEPTLTLDVWPDKAPGETGSIGPEKVLDQNPGEAVDEGHPSHALGLPPAKTIAGPAQGVYHDLVNVNPGAFWPPVGVKTNLVPPSSAILPTRGGPFS